VGKEQPFQTTETAVAAVLLPLEQMEPLLLAVMAALVLHRLFLAAA
jgi:hypothetical protein